MYISKTTKILLKVSGVPGTRFSDTIRCDYVDLCHFILTHAEKSMYLTGGGRNNNEKTPEYVVRYRFVKPNNNLYIRRTAGPIWKFQWPLRTWWYKNHKSDRMRRTILRTLNLSGVFDGSRVRGQGRSRNTRETKNNSVKNR